MLSKQPPLHHPHITFTSPLPGHRRSGGGASGISVKKTLWLMAIALFCVGLKALDIRTPDGQARNWKLEQLRGLELKTFQTTRVKGIEKIEDTWQGIDLLPWLKDQSEFFWHELEFVSVDGHSLRLHRADLETKPVWLALRDSKGWLEEGIRLVFPGQRDNIWIRGLDMIILHGFIPLPEPRRIYPWASLKQAGDETGMIDLSDFIAYFWAETKGDLLLVSDVLKPVVLKYPEHLANAKLGIEPDAVSLLAESLPESLLPQRLIFIQMGNQAVIMPQALRIMPALARLLSWSLSPDWKAVMPLYEQYLPGADIPVGSWLERD